MDIVSNDNAQVEVRCLEVRFHPTGQADKYAVVGTILCRGAWAICALAADLGLRIPASISAASIAANVRYLTIMSRPRPFETLRAMDSQYWSFASITARPPQLDS